MKDRRVSAAQAVIVVVLLLAVLIASLLGGDATDTDSGFKYAVPADLNGHSLSVVTGSEYAEFALEYYPDSELLYVNDWTDTYMMVSQGKAEGLLTEDTDIEEVFSEYPNLAALPDPIIPMEYSFLTQKTNAGAALAAEFNEFLAQYKESGEYDALHEKWLEGDITQQKLAPCRSDGSKGALRVATSNDWVGYCYVVDGENLGLFLDITYRFCEWAGYTPVLDIAHFNAGFMGVLTGRYDLLAYGYVYTEERADEVCFTDPLEGANLLMLVRKDSLAGYTADIEAAGKDSFLKSLAISFEKNFIRERRWEMMLRGLGTTLALSICTALFGTILGALICFLYKRSNPFATGFARMYIKLFQGMPIVVLLLVLYYVVFGKSSISAFIVCALGFSLDFSAYVSDVFRTSIDAVPPGQMKAALALGFSKTAAFRSVVLPQAMQHILPVYRGQFVSMVKNTAVAGYISVEDLTRVSDIIRSRTYEAFFPLVSTAVIYFLLASLLICGLKLIELRTDPLSRDRRPKGVKL